MIRSTHLTPRDKALIQGVIDGLSNKEIAQRLKHRDTGERLSEHTIKVYMSKLTQRLGISGRMALAKWGRDYIEGQRQFAAQLKEVLPDMEPITLGIEATAPTIFAGLRAVLMTTDFTTEEARELLIILLSKGKIVLGTPKHDNITP